MALAQDEKLEKRLYSLSSQISHDRISYYKILESIQKGSLEITEWLEWFLKTFIKAIEKSQPIVERALFVRNFWISHAQVELSLRQRKVIQKMLDLESNGFVGGMTNRKYVSIAKVSAASAKRDLLDLEKKGLLKRGTAKGRSLSYFLKINKF